MSRLLKIAIVGRPNVGKSALFNRICKKQIAIVDEAEGVTRDRLYFKTEHFGFPYEIVDTGGIHTHSTAQFNAEIRRQAEIAIEEADSIIMVVDSQTGPTDLDLEVSHILHRTHKPLCLAVNKIDNREQEVLLHEFYPLGISQMIAVSALHGYQIAELLDAALARFDRCLFVEPEDLRPKIALLGRPNVGKSSLLNGLLQEERSIVSPIAGTTRDSIDTIYCINNTEYTLIDTAGIRRKQKEKDVIEKFAAIRTDRAIERADVCLLLLDAQQGITTQEKKIANAIEEAGKGCILLLNKWDLVKGFRMEHCLQGIEQEVPFLKHCPKLFISAYTGRNLDKVFPLVETVLQAQRTRISTPQLNKCISAALKRNHPTMVNGKRLKIYYLAQVDICPPRFILFVNNEKLMEDTYKKYLIHQLRKSFPFDGTPLLLHLKDKSDSHKTKSSGNHQQEVQSRALDSDFSEKFLEQDQESTSLLFDSQSVHPIEDIES